MCTCMCMHMSAPIYIYTQVFICVHCIHTYVCMTVYAYVSLFFKVATSFITKISILKKKKNAIRKHESFNDLCTAMKVFGRADHTRGRPSRCRPYVKHAGHPETCERKLPGVLWQVFYLQ